MIKNRLEKLIKKALKDLSVSADKIPFEHPADFSHGDYSTNVALIYGKQHNKNPKEFAEEILGHITKGKIEEVEKIEIAGPGFINFFLSKSFFLRVTGEIIESKDNWGKKENLKGQKIIIEHTQPNPFKEFHIGHLVNNTVGEATSRLLEAQGAEVKKVTYHGDVGLHVAKAIWAMVKEDLNPKNLSDWGKSYVEGDKFYQEDPKARQEIIELNKKVYQGTDEKINELYELGKNLSLKHFQDLYSRLGSRFHSHFFESEAGEIGKRIVERFLKGSQSGQKEIFEKSEGAVIFPESKSGLHTRVFINSEGLPTYEAKDLGLIKLKKEFFDFDRSITVTDIEQAEYYKVVIKAAELIFSDLVGKIEHLSHGRLRLAQGRVSSRTGNIIGGEDLLNQLQELALEKMKDRNIEKKSEVADQIAVAALKYSILKQSPGKNIVFDFEKSLSFEGDSGPYLQYSCVRARSVLKKASEEKIKNSTPNLNYEEGLWKEKKTIDLERLMYRFPEVVERSGREYSPQHLISFLTDLAGSFNSFYAGERIVDKEDRLSAYKISLTEAFLVTMKSGLHILGIQVPEKM